MTSPVQNSSTGSLASALTASRNGSPVGPGGNLGKDEFLRLLTTQLRYQDPMDPMDGKDMAADLAQFSGLEQLLNINESLLAQQGHMDALSSAVQNSVAMNAIGKTVMAEGDKVILTADDDGVITGKVTADITTSGVATLTLIDQSGKEVGSQPLGYLGTGRQNFVIDVAAEGLEDTGAYAYRIDVADAASGKDVPQKTYTVGKIDGLTYGEDGVARLLMGPLIVDFSAIMQIFA